MNIYDIARAADCWGDSILAAQERRDAIAKGRAYQIRRRAEELAEDPDELESMRASKILAHADVVVRLADGTVMDLDRAHDMLRDAARSDDTTRANLIAVAAQRAIVDELVARAEHWFDDGSDECEPLE